MGVSFLESLLWCSSDFYVFFFNDFLRKISLSETLRHYYYYVTITVFDIREEFQILIYIFFYFPSNFNIVFFCAK